MTGDHLAQTAACGMVPFLLSIDARMEFRNSSAKDELAGGSGWLEIGLFGLAFFWRPREPFEVVCNSTPGLPACLTVAAVPAQQLLQEVVPSSNRTPPGSYSLTVNAYTVSHQVTHPMPCSTSL